MADEAAIMLGDERGQHSALGSQAVYQVCLIRTSKIRLSDSAHSADVVGPFGTNNDVFSVHPESLAPHPTRCPRFGIIQRCLHERIQDAQDAKEVAAQVAPLICPHAQAAATWHAK